MRTINNDGSSVISSFDIEIGGEFAGIIKLPAELVQMKLVAGQGIVQGRVEEVMRVATFDSYVKPECNIWDQRCIDIHQIHLTKNVFLMFTTLTKSEHNSRPG